MLESTPARFFLFRFFVLFGYAELKVPFFSLFLEILDKALRASFRFQVSSFRFQVSGFKFQVSSFRFQVSSFRFQVSGLNFKFSILNSQLSILNL